MAALGGPTVGHPNPRAMAPNTSRTTSAPRLGRMTCSTANAATNTHSHCVFTRTDVSSLAITSAAVTWAAMARRSAQRRAGAGEDVAQRAFADRQAKISASTRRNRSSPIAWA